MNDVLRRLKKLKSMERKCGSDPPKGSHHSNVRKPILCAFNSHPNLSVLNIRDVRKFSVKVPERTENQEITANTRVWNQYEIILTQNEWTTKRSLKWILISFQVINIIPHQIKKMYYRNIKMFGLRNFLVNI